MNIDAPLPVLMTPPVIAGAAAATDAPGVEFSRLLAAVAPMVAPGDGGLPGPIRRDALLPPPAFQPVPTVIPPLPRVANRPPSADAAANLSMLVDIAAPASTATSSAGHASPTTRPPVASHAAVLDRARPGIPAETVWIEPAKAHLANGLAPSPAAALSHLSVMTDPIAEGSARRPGSSRTAKAVWSDDQQVAEAAPAVQPTPIGASTPPTPALPQAIAVPMTPLTPAPPPITPTRTPTQVIAAAKSAPAMIAPSPGTNPAIMAGGPLPVPAAETVHAHLDVSVVEPVAASVSPPSDAMLMVTAAHPAPAPTMPASTLAPGSTTTAATRAPTDAADPAVLLIAPIIPTMRIVAPAMSAPESAEVPVTRGAPIMRALLTTPVQPVLALTTAAPVTVTCTAVAPATAPPPPALLKRPAGHASALLPLTEPPPGVRPVDSKASRPPDPSKPPGATASDVAEPVPAIAQQPLSIVPVLLARRHSRAERIDMVDMSVVAPSVPSPMAIADSTQQFAMSREVNSPAPSPRNAAMSPAPLAELAVTTDRFGDVRIAVEGTATDVKVALGLASTTLLGAAEAQRLATGLAADLAATGVRLQSLEISGGDGAGGGSSPGQREPAPHRAPPTVFAAPRATGSPASLIRSDRYA